MKQAVIEFSGTLVVRPNDEYEGEGMSLEAARGWVSHALSRGDKHASDYDTSGGVMSIEFEDYDEEE